MGIGYYLIDEEKREKYELGRGSWTDYGRTPTPDEIKEQADAVLTTYSESQGFARRQASAVWKWAEEHKPVAVVSDVDDEFVKYDDYEQTGSVFDVKDMSREEVRRKVEKVTTDLKEELGADAVMVTVYIDELEQVEEVMEYAATSAQFQQFSGYRRVDRPYKLHDDGDF